MLIVFVEKKNYNWTFEKREYICKGKIYREKEGRILNKSVWCNASR